MSTTSTFFITQPAIQLINNVNQMYWGSDLADFFDPYNLDFTGITRNEFIAGGGVLPEGNYTICFQAFKNPTIPLIARSNEACAIVNIQLYAPPIITAPIGAITATEPPSFLISWLPQHPVNVTTDYMLKMWETVDGISNNDVINNYQPVLKVTTMIPSYLYSAADPALVTGQEYILQVQVTNTTELPAFANNGISELQTFVYTAGTPSGSCDSPLNVSLTSSGETAMKLVWSPPDTGNPPLGYSVQWRGYGNDPVDWQLEPTIPETDTQFLLNGLAPGNAYEVQIRTQCMEEVSSWVTVIDSIAAPAPEPEEPVDVTCGVILDGFPDGNTPLPALAPGETFYAGDFNITTTAVSGSNGLFFGKGYIDVPYFNGARVNVKYNAIRVNKERYLYQGEVVVTGAGLNLLGDDLANLLGDILTTLETIDELLAAAETILQTIDEIIALFEPYLPDNVMQQLIDAQAALAAALQNYNNAVAYGDQDAIAAAATALENAQSQLSTANDVYTAALQEFIQKFLDIIIQSINQLRQDLSPIANDYANAQNVVNSWTNAQNTQLLAAIPSAPDYESLDENQKINLEGEFFKLDDYSNIPNSGEFINQANTFYEAEANFNVFQLVDIFKAIIANEAQVEEFTSFLLDEGIDLLDGIGTRIKNEIPQSEIIDFAKNEIFETLTQIVARL